MIENEQFRFYPPEILSLNAPDLEKMVLYRKIFPEQGHEIIIRPLCLERDVKTIHRWINELYAHRYRQMQGGIEELCRHYEKFLDSGNGYSLMCFLRNKPAAQVDFYDVAADEIKDQYDVQPGDHGIHVLMAPYRRPVPPLPANVIITCLSFLFTLSIDRIIAAPDINNKKANALVKSIGFRFMKQVWLSYEPANLYCYNRRDFLREHP
jgi:hypothetical protein